MISIFHDEWRFIYLALALLYFDCAFLTILGKDPPRGAILYIKFFPSKISGCNLIILIQKYTDFSLNKYDFSSLKDSEII